MRTMRTIVSSLLLLGIGFVAGSANLPLFSVTHAFDDAAAPAQGEAGEVQLAEETRTKIHDAKLALQDAMDALEAEGRYGAITDGINAFLVLSGGGDALSDLESGHGVDPETFSGLYAGLAIPEVGDHLAKDEQGRLTYKGKVVRMYSQARLERLFNTRTQLLNPGL
jgi:hypothetical protein